MTYKYFLLSSDTEIGNEAFLNPEFRNHEFLLRYGSKHVLWFINQEKKENKNFEHCPEYKFYFGGCSSYFYLSKIMCPVLNLSVNTLYSLSFNIKFRFPDQNPIPRQSKGSTTLKTSHSSTLGAVMHLFYVLGNRELHSSEIPFVLYASCLWKEEFQ